jgi:hypothetical protein
MTGEGQQVEHRQHARQMLVSVSEIMLEVVAVGFGDIERLVLDLPACAATGRGCDDIVPADLQVGDEAVRRFGQLG